jgi:hypothetical protein
MVAQLSDEALELLASDAVATVVTLNPDGSAHLSAAWVGIEDGEIVFATLPDQRNGPRTETCIHSTRRDGLK